MPVRIARKLARAHQIARPTRAGLRVGIAAALIIFGCETVETVIANGDTRTLSFRHTHRSDDLTITFKRNGRYDDEALKKLNYFLRDWRSDEQTRMDPQLFDILWEVYREVGGKAPIHIISSYRSPTTNAMLRRRGRGVARFSQHMLGKAMDFFIPGVPLEDLRYAGLRLQRGGVGFYPTSGSPFVHLDTGNVRHWPRMPEAQLAAVMRGRSRLMLAARRDETPRLALAARPGADDEDVTAAAPRKSKPNALARLFGFARDEDEDEAAPAVRAPAPQPVAVQPRPVQAEPVPVPTPRPTRPATFALASADSVPARQPEPRAAAEPAPVPPAAIPQAEARPAQPAPGAIGTGGQRFVWMTGPQGRPAESVHVRSAPDVGPETTASLAPWPMPRQNDRVPSDLALAYAAEAMPERPRAAASAAAPMGALRPAPAPATAAAPAPRPAAVVARPAAPARTAAAPTPAPRAGFTLNDPWIRSLVMARSVQHEMTVSTVGLPDPMGFRTLMHKPRASVALVFSADPYLGLGTDRFGGPAIAFVPTVTFNLRTAQLN